MNTERIYSFLGERLEKVHRKGMELTADALVSDGEGYIILPYIDSGKPNAKWGRLHMDLELSPKSICNIYVAALNNLPGYQIAFDEGLFETVCTENCVNKEDMLLYSMEGRYLLVMIAVKGEGHKSVGGIKIYTYGDFLMDEFPEVYRERNSVLHRYLSIFSTIYMDMKEKIDRMQEYLMPDKAPVDMLLTLGDWMGLDLRGGFLDEEDLRSIVREAYSLNRKRGTRESLSRLAKLLTGEKPVIVERNLMPRHVDRERERIENRLYGDGIYDVTIIMPKGKKQYKTSQMLFLMNQLKPARCVLRLISLNKSFKLDSYTYLDINASLQDEGRLEVLDWGVRLK